jgi:CheY-like chemotaxis protein
VLEQAGHIVTAVATGLEAAQVLMQTVPRLIVMDLDLKWLSGRQLIEVLRHNPRTSFIPIVAIGGAVEDLHGIPLLLRPVEADQLRAVVDHFLPQPGHHDGDGPP